MARYIDADRLCEALKSMASVQYPDKQNTILGVVSSIENFPTADVVPRSEVDELKAIIADHKTSEERWEELYSDAKSEVKQLQSEVTTLLNDLAVATLKYKNAEAETASEVIAELQRMWNVRALAGHKCGLEVYIISKRDYRSLVAELEKKYTKGGME